MYLDRINAIKHRQPNIIGHETSFKSSVLIPLVIVNDELAVLFERRAFDLDVQPGEVCFPGGGIEPEDDSAAAAAIRETCEELNLCNADLEILAALDIFVSPFNIIVYPFAGIVHDLSKVSINKDEVEYYFCVPLSFLMENEPQESLIKMKVDMPEDYPWDLIPGGRGYPYRQAYYSQYFYQWNGEVIWGLTARILKHFLDLIRSV